ncbi:hypothetical protein PENTCL1PPCAC_7014 [Pristionchus entomophagus]|uniref:Mediator of RNA polymerase II transcription subunit 13 n=1 Tax=Pristionchus entomophagus TaxID=358040 RepID=A0AAV5STY3_9BILA|nr:hypothetical protein PENTCL1PPCAC_7014 [Pristionchus entomophagus]
MSTANGGSLDDCITNLFALTELNGLQWRLYESPSSSIDANPQTLLQSDPIFVAYSKLQTDGILSVWRRMPTKVLPEVFNLLPILTGTTAKELWVFWYGATEPEEIEKHCNDLTKKKSEEELDDGTMNAIPYDVRCLLYKAWNTQMEKHYRSRKFLQIGRWFFRPQKFLDPNAAFIIDDFALAHSHSFNIVGGNSMCMAVKTQLQPNLVHLAPFHIERNRKFREEKVNVLLAPWSLNGHISLRYSVMAQTNKEEEEVDKQLSQWKEANMFVDVKKKKRRREEGGETQGEESEEEGWGQGVKMPKMIRVELDGDIRMWWPTQYVLVTLEETRRLVRDRFPVADHVKSVPDKEPMSSNNRFAHLTSSETSLRLSQAVVDEGNLKKGKTKSANDPSTVKKTVGYKNRRLLKDVEDSSKEDKMSFEGRTRSKLEKEALIGQRVRISSVNSDDEMEGEEKKEKPGMTRELKRMMKSSRYNWRGKNGRILNTKETELKCYDSSSSEAEDADKREESGEKGEREWTRGNGEGPDKIAREIYMHPEKSSYHFDPAGGIRRRQSNESEDEERMAKSPFTPVRVLSPIDKPFEMSQMSELIKNDLRSSGENPRDNGPASILREYGAYFDVNAAGTSSDLKYKSYHSRRRGPRTQPKVSGRSMQDDIPYCSSDEEYDTVKHICHRRSPLTPVPMRPPRPPHVIPIFETELVGGINQPPLLHFKPDLVIRQKSSKFHPTPNIPLSWPMLSESDDLVELNALKNLENSGLDLGSDEEPSDDRYSTGSVDVVQPLSVAGERDDAGEGTSSGAENWRDEEMEMEEHFLQTNMDSSSELMDHDGMPHSDSVLSPPASNERADSHNSMYHRLPGGPHSVGESTALNKIYPTPPSLLQVDICSPAMMGGPHSQARKDDRDDGSSHSSDDEDNVKYLDQIGVKEDERSRGDHTINHLHSDLFSRKFFDNAPKTDVPLSSRFGSLHERLRVSEKRSMPVYNKRDGEKKEQIPSHLAEVVAAIDNHTNSNSISAAISATSTGTGGSQSWQHPHQSLPYPSLAAQQHHQLQLQQMQQQQHLQPGPSSMAPPLQPSYPNQMQPHPAYLGGGGGPTQGQMGQMGSFPGQTTAMRNHFPPPYGGTIQQHPIQQPGFPPPSQQQQPQYPGGVQMMMTSQSGFHPGMQMRPSGYVFPPGTNPSMGVHPMQSQAMGHHMTYQPGMQNQMIYRQGMPPTSYAQYGSPMGGMMAPSTAIGGMQMGQYGGQTMPQPGMMMHPSQQPMIAGPVHPMGVAGGMAGHPSFPMVPPLLPPSQSSQSAASVVSGGNQPRPAGLSPGKKQLAGIQENHLDTLIATRRGEDPYLNSLSIAPKNLFYKGTSQLKTEFDLYTTERIMEKERKRGDRPFCSPVGGSEGLSIVAAVMLQDTILNLHFDWVFDSCPICACTTSIKSRDLGVYIKPPEALEESVAVQEEWMGPWSGFNIHKDSKDTSCTCGFSVIRHRQLSMRAGLFIEDSREATGDDNSATNPMEGTSDNIKYLWFNACSAADRALVETLRSIALTTDIGRFVSALKNISSVGLEKERRNRRKKNENEKIPSVGSIGTCQVEYVISQMDKMELLLMGNSALTTAHTSGNPPSPKCGESPYFHSWGLQIASEVADPTEMEIKNLLEDVKPLIEGAVREARKLSSSLPSVIEGPLTWRALAAKNVKSSGNGDDDSHIAEPIPLIEMSTEREAIRVAPTIIKNWEQFNLGPIDIPKDVLYLAVVPDDEKVFDMTVVYMRRLSKMYELNLRLGRHVAYLVKDDLTLRTPVREGIVRASPPRSRYPPSYGKNNQSPVLEFLRDVEKMAKDVGCNKEFIRKLTSYVTCLEDVVFEHLNMKRIFERDTFRECVAYALMNRKVNQKQKQNNPTAGRHERDTEEGSPPGGEEEEEKRGEEKRKESQMYSGALAEALGMGPSSSSEKEKQKPKHPFGQSPAYGMDGDRVLKSIDWPEEEPAALPQTVVIYVMMWPCCGSSGRDGESARVAMIALVKAFNAVMKRLPDKHRGLCLLELVPIQRLEEVVGCGADMDRLDRSSNLNTWQIGNMNRNSEVYPTDKPRIEDILKEIALGVYRKPRFLHCENLKNCLPKSMTKFGPASAMLDWIDRKDGKKKTIYRCPSVPYQLATTPAIVAKNEGKYSQLCMDEVSLYISYCLVGIDFVVVTLTDNLGARNESAVLNLNPKQSETSSTFRSKNKTSVHDGLERLWKFIEGVMLNESKPFRLVIGKLGKMGHGEFKAWCHVLARSNLKKYNCGRVKESCAPCNGGAGAPTLLSACLVSTEPEAHLQVLPSYSIPPDPNAGAQKKIRPLHTPGDNTITHIMVFPISSAIQLTQSTDMGEVNDDEDDFGNLDGGLGLVGDDMNDIMNEIMVTGEGEGERAAPRTTHMNSYFEGPLESGVQNQPLAAGWMISTAPGGDLPDWFWSSCPSLKRRLPVHLRCSLHINEAQLMRSDDIMKKEKEQEISHALDSQKTDEVLRHVLEQYNDLSWLAIDSITQERRSCLPIHIQALTRLHDAVLNLIM